MKKLCLILAIASAMPNAYAVTATKEYVDRRDGEVAAALVPATNAAVTASKAYTDSRFAPTTNAAVTASKAYTDSKFDAVPEPDFTPSNAVLRATIEGVAPAPGNYAMVSNRAMTALQSHQSLAGKIDIMNGWSRYLTLIDATVWEGLSFTTALPGHGVWTMYPGRISTPDGDIEIPSASGTLALTSQIPSGGVNPEDLVSATNNLSKTIPNNIVRTANDATLVHCDNGTCTNPIVYIRQATSSLAGLMTAADKNALDGLPSEVATAKSNAAQALQYSSATFSFMNANTNAWFAGTNYVIGAQAESKTKFAFEDGMDFLTMPCSMALYELRDGSRQQVWDQRDWVVWFWNFKSAQMRAEIAATNAELSGAVSSLSNAMPSKAWSKYTAAGGLDNADTSTTWIDTPKVTLAPGMAWETVAEVEGCAYWTIVGNAAIGGEAAQQTNGVLTIRDFEGKPVMRIRKGESYQAFLECGSEIYTSGSDAQGRVTFTMRASVQPTGMFSTVLDDTLFVEETDEGCPVNYEWETVSQGVYRCHFLLKPGILSTACFAKFKVAVEGSTTIEYTAAPTISGGLIYQGVKIAPVIPANPSVGDTITWKVVQ